MKKTTIVLALFTAVQLVSAQERLSSEESLRYVRGAGVDAEQLKAAPLATDVDPNKPVAVRYQDYGGLVLPQKNINVDQLASAGSKITPVGQFWLHKLTLRQDGAAVPESKLFMVSASVNGATIRVPQCALGVRRNAQDKLELLVFGKDKTPLLTVPLEKDEETLESPLDLTGEVDGDSGQVTLKVLGKYKAAFEVVPLQ
jgi:hypothetical protein